MRRDTRRRNIDSVAHVAWLARSEVNRGSSMLGWRRMGRCSSSSHPRMLLSSRTAQDDALGRLFGRSYQLAPMSSARLRQTNGASSAAGRHTDVACARRPRMD